jgi:glycosyltransferase involved in cell wall biosynthesis
MAAVKRHPCLLCITGSRVINKRMAMLLESAQDSGFSVRIRSLPRGPWVLDKSERPTVVRRTNWMTADLGPAEPGRLTAILCVHWFVLPVAVLLGWLRRVPVIYDEHDHYELNTLEGTGPLWKRRTTRRLVQAIHRFCLPHVSLVTCIHQHNAELRQHLLRWQPRVLEIHNFPAEAWRNAGSRRQPAGPLCFVYIGGVYREKGVAAAAEAYRSLPATLRSQAELHVFGEGDDTLIAELTGHPGITVHRGVTPEAFRQFAATRRCCGLALLADTPRYRLVGTNCTKLYEYLALGMPVIASCVGEFPRQIADWQVGLLIDASLPASDLATAMQQLLSDPQLFNRYAENALQQMSRSEMTWEHEWRRIMTTGAFVIPQSRAA